VKQLTDYKFINIDRQYREDLASWFKEFRWDFICTLTFPMKVSDGLALNLFRKFVRLVEKTMRCDVSYLCSSEKRFSGVGRPGCGRHFHLVMTCGASVSPRSIEQLWVEVAGSPRRDTGAKVDIYDSARDGVSYIVKLVNPSYDEWDFRNLPLVNPRIQALQPQNCRLRRTFRRYQARQHGRERAAVSDV